MNIPELFKKDERYDYMSLDEFSFVVHKHSIGEKSVSAELTTNLLVFILKGEKVFHTKGRSIPIGSGEAAFLKKGTIVLSEKNDKDGEYKSLLFFIDDTFIDTFITKYMHLLSTNKNVEVDDLFKIDSTDMLRNYLTSFIPYFTECLSCTKDILQIKFEELFLQLIISGETHFLQYLIELHNPKKSHLISFMNSHYHLNYTIEELASLTSYSVTTFKRNFKEIFRETPKNWINSKRLDDAYTLLVSSDKNVTEVCYEVGFESLSHFIQLFKKKFGVTPKKLIK